ncbi:N-acetyltransferase ESCO2-like, partial [Corapipo altera]|uniref:N-acetyltransferase ESCO2-like n=1 Tax=Corapipo altera TaxID=415028 RepID=UPI000FD623FD
SRKTGNERFPSQIPRSPNSGDETKENEAFPGKTGIPRRLEISPLQGEHPGKPSLKTSSQPHVPVGSFYGKGKHYLDPVERRKLQEIQVLGTRSGDGNAAPGRTEKSSGNRGGNRGGNPKPKAAKPAPNPKGGRGFPKKPKAEIPAGKAERETGNRLVRKKLDSPFRVLSMRVKPALKLRLGAAFFAAGKRSHSRKNPGDSRAIQALPKSPGGGENPPEEEEEEERGARGRIPEPPREEGRENRESPGNPGEPGHGGEASPRKTGNASRASGAEGVGTVKSRSRHGNTAPKPGWISGTFPGFRHLFCWNLELLVLILILGTDTAPG